MYTLQYRFNEAETPLKRSVAIQERAQRPNQGLLAYYLLSLGSAYLGLGNFAEAEQAHRQAVKLLEGVSGQDHHHLISMLVGLGTAYTAQGRYAEAETVLKRARAIAQKGQGPNPVIEFLPINERLGSLYLVQDRYAEAEPLLKWLVDHDDETRQPDRLRADHFHRLGSLYSAQGRFAEAEPFLKRALAIQEKTFNFDSPLVAEILHDLAELYRVQNLFAQAEPLLKRGLAIKEKALGQDSHYLPSDLAALAIVYRQTDRFAEAMPLLDRAISISKRAGDSPGTQYYIYSLRALNSRMLGRRADALADLRLALDSAERGRSLASGAEQDQAKLFGGFARAFELMVAWQAELGDYDEALSAMERARARILAEQMDRSGVDLLAGLPADQAEALRRREAEARSLVSRLEQQRGLLEQRRDLALEERKQQADSLQRQLAQAQRDYVDAYRDVRNASPACRHSLAQDRKPVSLAALRDWAVAHKSLVLEYMVGDEQSFVLTVPGGGGEARLESLMVNAAQAGKLGIEAGPLTASRLLSALSNPKNTGVLQRISTPGSDQLAVDQLAALWELLVPPSERTAIQEGKFKQLVVLPDGPLTLFPFEALVVEADKEPKYLLDAGAPIVYGPSATVLYNLAERPAASPATDREPVLSVGDPAYEEPGVEAPASESALAVLTSRSRYGGVGGRMNRLPHSGTEMQWVAQSFQEAGIQAVTLTQATATERGVRYWSPGRRVLHLACHGLADQKYGNFFGALALTPGPKGSDNPADDGFLTLPEIYELNLRGCELAILSACQTNYGPQQKGEGTWALSRGFLVAGARRVVASNWLVDDEAAASLVSRFCGGLAQAEKAGKNVDYAGSLQEAKRYVRKQEKWRSPYYWASLVLIGPP